MPRLPHKPPSAATKIGGMIAGSPGRTSRRPISPPGRVSNYLVGALEASLETFLSLAACFDEFRENAMLVGYARSRLI